MDSSRRWLAFGLIALGIGLAANSILGPFGLDVVDYHFSTTLINQGIGLDIVALFAVAPVAVIAGVLVLRGSPAGPVVGFIPATFATYMMPQYVVGPEYLDLPGNNEQFFLLHLGLFVLAIACLVGAWNSVDRASLRPASRTSDHRRSWVLFGVAAFILIGRWMPGILDLLSGDPEIVDFLENPTSYLLIGILDLGLVFPAAVITAVALRRGVDWARTASYAVIGWFALVPASVAAMALTMVVNDDPHADSGLATIFSVMAIIFTVGAVLLYRPMFDSTAVQPDGQDRDGAEI